MNDLVVDRLLILRMLLFAITGNEKIRTINLKYLTRKRLVKRGLATDDQYNRAVNALYERDHLELILQANPMKDALEVIDRFVNHKPILLQPVIISRVDDDAKDLLHLWMEGHGLKRKIVPFFAVGRNGEKSQVNKVEELLAYVDHEIEQLDKLALSTRFLILFDRFGERQASTQKSVGRLRIRLLWRRIRLKKEPDAERSGTFIRTIIIVRSWKELERVLLFIVRNVPLAERMLTLPENPSRTFLNG